MRKRLAVYTLMLSLLAVPTACRKGTIPIEYTDFIQDSFKHLENGTVQIAGNSF